MSHILEVPDDLYRKIAHYATEAKQEPDTLILSWVTEAAQRLNAKPTQPPTSVTFDEGALTATDDPMTLLAGIIDSHDPGWANDHDSYFGYDDPAGDNDD